MYKNLREIFNSENEIKITMGGRTSGKTFSQKINYIKEYFKESIIEVTINDYNGYIEFTCYDFNETIATQSSYPMNLVFKIDYDYLESYCENIKKEIVNNLCDVYRDKIEKLV